MPDYENTTILSLPLIQGNQAQKHVTHNEALRILDALVQPVVVDLDRTVPPASPENGQRHIVAPGAVGEWAGRDNAIAVRQDAAWGFFVPQQGWRCHVEALAADAVFDGGAWQKDGTADRVETFGINTLADDTNRLAVAADATLLDNAGGGHQLKINKATEADTASLLFQTGYAGRAEMGLAGDGGFAVKVSADGASWTTAMAIDGASGAATFSEIRADAVVGDAVQSDPTDRRPGRLMRADYGYGPGNVVGPVAQANGVPTGAVIESGTTPNGSYLRYADGTQICTIESFATAREAAATWRFPKAFATTTGLFVSITATFGGGPRIFAVDKAEPSGVDIRSWTEGGSQNVAPTCCVMAVGRWTA
ncbi:DUF2793 domain-containing protein [uncultured Jannaschia sp.]|uniref:DUF2793 domain-containing protein n=1 Tax=uncultured Jannaschia sp. TaxID=293347 RepID=UPI00260E6247|nr:DUF2793 domain-containing protein [uncultured Jannaschia sp.]